jgi:hypothetical protein
MTPGLRPDYLDAFMKVARLICDNDPPTWLAERLWKWSRWAYRDRIAEEIRPTRTQMRSELQEIENAAFLLAEVVEPCWAREFLDAAGTGPIDNPERLKRALEDLGYRAEKARHCPALATKTGVTKPGPGKARPEGMSRHTLCAVMILDAWRHVRGREPSPKNRLLAQAAEAYWRTIGGKGHHDDRSNEPLAFWKHHFKKAAGSIAKEFRDEWKRHLVEAERSWKRRNSVSQAA